MCVFVVQVHSRLSITNVAPHPVRAKQVTGVRILMRAIYLSPGTNIMRSSEAIRVYHQLQNCLGCASKSKNHDEPINFVVRVSSCLFCYISYEIGWTGNFVRFPRFFNFNYNCFCYPVMNCTSIIINKILQKSKTKF